MQPPGQENPISIRLSPPVAIYLSAVKAKDPDRLALCFAADARVHDENREYQGLDAIKAWQQEAHAKYHYVMEPLDASVSENGVKLRARLMGDFPGNQVELDYLFTLANDKITALEIE
jgi:hypothetical protein